MIRDSWAGMLMLAFCAVLPVRADIAATNRTGSGIHISPGPEDGRIALKTAQMLEGLHFSHHLLDSTYGSQFMDFYLEALDPQHLHFLETDLADFERYRTNLNNLTLTTNRQADVTPAFEIFARYIERLQQRVAYVDDLLQHEKFDFTSDDRIILNRHELSYPKDMDEAKKVWRDRLRFEYLEQKLGLEDAKKNKATGTNINTVSLQTNINDLPLGKVLENAGVSTPATTNAVKSVHEQIVETLTHRYHRGLHMYADWNNQDVMGVYLTALAHVYDPHSDYFNKAELDQFTINMNLALFGIGAELVFDDGYCKIRKLLGGGPAEKSKKIAVGDRIVAVAQSNQPPVDVVEMNLNKTVQMIRGPKGTEVQLTIIPEHESAPRNVISLIRDEIPLPDQAAKGKIIELPGANGENKRLGVIDLPSFYAPIGPSSRFAGDSPGGEYASVDVAKLLNKFKHENVTGVILDLRRNGGGSLEEAIRLAGLFIKKGPIVQVRAADGRGMVARDPDETSLYDGPLIVLTSRFSASASEIVAAALQDYGRALIVGDVSTHGKGTVQSVNYLTNFPGVHFETDPGALKVTVQKFYRASGVSTQLKGVLPDIVLPTVWNYSKDIGESSLDHPLECDTIPSADYDKLDLVQPYLGDLLKRTNERLATNKDFAYVYEEIEKFRKQQDDKTISLNEQQRRKEMEENTARDKARNKERLSRKEPDQKTYTITLKQADLPGLPLPDQKTNSIAAKSLIMSGAGTNTAAVSSSAMAEQDEEVAPVPDADLDEAERILMDYISLLQKRALVTLNHSPL